MFFINIGSEFNRQFNISHCPASLASREVRKGKRIAKKGSNVIGPIDHLNSFAFHFPSLSTASNRHTQWGPRTIWLMDLMNSPVKPNVQKDRELLFALEWKRRRESRKASRCPNAKLNTKRLRKGILFWGINFSMHSPRNVALIAR